MYLLPPAGRSRASILTERGSDQSRNNCGGPDAARGVILYNWRGAPKHAACLNRVQTATLLDVRITAALPHKPTFDCAAISDAVGQLPTLALQNIIREHPLSGTPEIGLIPQTGPSLR